MQINELVTFAADVGRGLLESGAETSRVEDTVERIIRHFYDGKSEVLVVLTGLVCHCRRCYKNGQSSQTDYKP